MANKGKIKSKYYLSFGFLSIAYHSACLVINTFLIRLFIVGLSKIILGKLEVSIYNIILLILLIAFILFTFMIDIKYWQLYIKIDKEKISTKGNTLIWKSAKIQFPASVEFNKIEEVKIVLYQRQSNGKLLLADSRAGLPMGGTFLFIKNSRGFTKFYIGCMTKHTMIKLLTELSYRINLSGNSYVFDINRLIDDFVTKQKQQNFGK